MLIRWRQTLRLLRRDTSGVAAVEFAIATMLLVVGVLNAVDFGYYMYQRIEVENAAEVGAQAAWKTCYDQSSMLPATEYCPGLDAAITTAIQSTSLGTAVSLVSGYPSEGYYCVNSSGALQLVASAQSTEPANCSAVGDSSISPGDYIQVAVTYNYTPLFSISVIGGSSIRSITMTSWMRLG
jgi:Flp pilus assembly protein TadG